MCCLECASFEYAARAGPNVTGVKSAIHPFLL